MTFTLEVFEIIQEAITLKNNKTKRRLKSKITENVDLEIKDSVIPSYYFSVLTAMMDIEIPDDDIDEVQDLIKPICRKYTIQNIPTYLTDLFIEYCDDCDLTEQVKEKLTNIFSKTNTDNKETQEICDYCCNAMGIVASSMGIVYNKESFDEKVNSILFDTINCEESDSEDEDDKDDVEEFLQVLETDDMIDIENDEVFEENKDVDEDVDEDYTDDTEEYSSDDEELYNELEEKQKQINLLKKQIEELREENKFLNNSISNIEVNKNMQEKNTNLILFGLVIGVMYVFGPSYFYMRTHPDMISMSS